MHAQATATRTAFGGKKGFKDFGATVCVSMPLPSSL